MVGEEDGGGGGEEGRERKQIYISGALLLWQPHRTARSKSSDLISACCPTPSSFSWADALASSLVTCIHVR